jgi:NAD(P)-dependent dehydrogenase (short-subunit alcohol dehydrogenase family)
VTAAPAPGNRGRFADRVAIVTGAAGGIGLATAHRLAAEGARIVMADRDVERATQERAGVAASGAPDVLVQACDVADERQVAACVDAATAHYGRLDVVVNNAGLMTFRPLVESTGDDWHRVLGVDLLGAFHFVKHGFRVMRSGAAIVNVASIHALETEPKVAPYAAAKAALVSLTRSAAIEGKPLGIRVNAVLPGAVDTPMLWDNPNVRAGIEHVDRAYVGSPEQVAAAIAFLASDDAAFVQGAALVVDGGRVDRL